MFEATVGTDRAEPLQFSDGGHAGIDQARRGTRSYIPQFCEPYRVIGLAHARLATDDGSRS